MIRQAMTSCEFRRLLRMGRSGLGGNYCNSVYLVMTDGTELCFECAQKEKVGIARSAYAKSDDGWRPFGFDINYESKIDCANCDERIEAEYGIYCTHPEPLESGFCPDCEEEVNHES